MKQTLFICSSQYVYLSYLESHGFQEHDKAVEHQQTQKTSLQQKIEEVEKSIEPVIEEIDAVNARLAAFEGELAAKVVSALQLSWTTLKRSGKTRS